MQPSPTLRSLIEDAVERLLVILDAIDGDADAEPSLGSRNAISQLAWAVGDRADLEEQCEGEGEDRDEGAIEYGLDGDGIEDQSRIAPHYGAGVAVSPLGAR